MMAKRIGAFDADETAARKGHCRHPVKLRTTHVNSLMLDWLNLDDQRGRYCVVHGTVFDTVPLHDKSPLGAARIFFSNKDTAFEFKMRWV